MLGITTLGVVMAIWIVPLSTGFHYRHVVRCPVAHNPSGLKRMKTYSTKLLLQTKSINHRGHGMTDWFYRMFSSGISNESDSDNIKTFAENDSKLSASDASVDGMATDMKNSNDSGSTGDDSDLVYNRVLCDANTTKSGVTGTDSVKVDDIDYSRIVNIIDILKNRSIETSSSSSQPPIPQVIAPENVTDEMVKSHPKYIEMVNTLDKLGEEYDEVCKQIDILKPEVEALQAQFSDEAHRLREEFRDMQERARREQEELVSKAALNAMRDVLPIADNFQRVNQFYENPESRKDESENERRIYELYNECFQKLMKTIESFSVAKVPTIGTQFDVSTMEAVMAEASKVYEKGVVTQEFQMGYMMGDKCVRPALVAVSTGPGPARATGSDS